MEKKVAVLMGGLSSEREVSLNTGKAVSNALNNLGYKVFDIDVNRSLYEALKEHNPDVVFNALHGTYGEDGCIPGLLELMEIPYTHSGVLASAVAMDKPMAKRVFESISIKCAPGRVVSREETRAGDVLPRPYVLKPLADGSSVDVHIISEGDPIPEIDDEYMLAEKFITGRELSVAVMRDKALGVIEIKPKQGFYDYKNKYTRGMTEYIVPAPVDKKIYDKAVKIAEEAHKVLGCRGVTRSDIRYDDEAGELYMLEINTHPGMTETSLVPKMAAHAGISFNELVEILVKEARLGN